MTPSQNQDNQLKEEIIGYVVSKIPPPRSWGISSDNEADIISPKLLFEAIDLCFSKARIGYCKISDVEKEIDKLKITQIKCFTDKCFNDALEKLKEIINKNE